MGQEKLCEKDFSSVIVFSFSEPGAMGPHNMTFYTRSLHCILAMTDICSIRI